MLNSTLAQRKRQIERKCVKAEGARDTATNQLADAGCKVYKEMLVDYMDYRGLEAELLEWKEKYEQLSKKGSGV